MNTSTTTYTISPRADGTTFAPITNPTFDEVEKRIHDETYDSGEIRDLQDPYLPKMMLQCFEEFNSDVEYLFSREQIKAMWDAFTPQQQAAVVNGLNKNKNWY